MNALITQRQIKNEYNEDCDCIEKNYIEFFNSINLSLLLVSNFQSVPKIKSNFVIFTGGGNIYKEQKQRDFVEKILFEQSLQNNIPIIAICRGMQYINLLLGGSLSQSPHNFKEIRPLRSYYEVKTSIGTINVKNFHNDLIFISDLAKNLDIIAMDEKNNTVEAFYSKNKKILCFQWHPERENIGTISYQLSKDIITEFITNKGILNESRNISSR